MIGARVKTAHLAGRWYPASPDVLAAEIRGLLDAVPVATGATAEAPTALIAPHAGYQYSGACAAAGYARLRNSSATRVVVLAPAHRVSFRGAAVLPAEAYETPLGTVRIDTGVVAGLDSADLIRGDSAVFADEHAVEIQLPFLQTVLPRAAVVPVVIGALLDDDADELAACLRSVCAGANTVVVVSSDLTHYGARFDYLPFPATDVETVRARLRQLDLDGVALILAGDPDGFDRYLDRTGATFCGRAAISVFLRARARRGRAELLSYYTSLDVVGEPEHTVSYGSVAFWDD
jgi:AmmeMemoRadiSam system protein B